MRTKRASHTTINKRRKLRARAVRAARQEAQRTIREQLEKANQQLYQSLELLVQNPQAANQEQTQQLREKINKEDYRLLMRTKYCDVKHCPSVPFINPEKQFFKWPKSCMQRLKWLAVIIMKNKDTIGHCCQDHFDLEEDTLNCSFDSQNRLELQLREDVVPRFNLLLSRRDEEIVTKNTNFKNSLYQNFDRNISNDQDVSDHEENDQVRVKTEFCEIEIKEEPLDDSPSNDIDKDVSDHEKNDQVIVKTEFGEIAIKEEPLDRSPYNDIDEDSDAPKEQFEFISV